MYKFNKDITDEYIDADYQENMVGSFLTNYNNHIIDLILNVDCIKDSILDFGAGSGTLAKIIRNRIQKSPVCLEIDPNFKNKLIKNDFEVIGNILSTKKQFDLIYSSNVLEHIADDKEILKTLKSKLKQNGRLVLYLPAFDILFSEMDERVGHFRRYSKRKIIKISNQTGLKIDKMFYVDSVGFFASLAIRIFGWNSNDGIGSKKSLIIYDKFIFPLSKLIDRTGFRYLLGKNIFVSLKKSH
ncbi:MAG: hypothetical protein CMG55_00520 [Candidatus Marinimicrobia bacterium]|nr:hypothetical protein [Candidatus Neomarinimicrobiota bacterium]|tara:strand:- start:1037 stop:1762 length:726 start_codon:yes stop_codon:yes gene_type:complete